MHKIYEQETKSKYLMIRISPAFQARLKNRIKYLCEHGINTTMSEYATRLLEQDLFRFRQSEFAF